MLSTENKRRVFDRVYVEEAARDHPNAQRLLDRFSGSEIVSIGHYKDVFNRPRQEWRAQKGAPALILAKRQKDFLYEASAYTPDFGHARFCYNALALNCIYDCAYCYLQGMFPSAHITLFVNNEDYLAATDRALREGPLYLALSYDTDLLPFERLIPYARTWIDYARTRPDLTLEIRTKSAAYRLIEDIEPAGNVILAWTLSPQSVIESYEAKTPALERRMRAVGEALKGGWRVRICIDPILRVRSWETVYAQFVAELAARIDLSRIQDISLGVFRINKDYLKNMKRRATVTDLLYYPYERESDLATYREAEKVEMIETLRLNLLAHCAPEHIFVD